MLDRLDYYSPIWGLLLFVLASCTVYLLGRSGPLALPRRGGDGRLGEIDGLRGVLAFAVFLTHAASTYRFRAEGQWAWPDSWFYAMCGYIPVSLFFIITGYLFWRRAIEGRLQWPAFLLGRAFRILPLYFLSLTILLVLVGMESGWNLRQPPLDLLRGVAEWASVVFGRPDLNGVSPTWAMNPATWTLRPEAFFYLALPLAAVLATPARFTALASAVVVLVCLRSGVNGGGVGVHFLFGMAAAHLHVRFPSFPLLAKPAAAVACVAILLAAAAFHRYGYGLSFAAFAFPTFLCVVYGNTFFGLLKLTATRWLGEISYSLYLLHGLLLYGGFAFVDAHAPVAQMTALQFWGLMAPVAVGLTVLSMVTYLKVEAPFLAAAKTTPLIRAAPAQEGLAAVSPLERQDKTV